MNIKKEGDAAKGSYEAASPNGLLGFDLRLFYAGLINEARARLIGVACEFMAAMPTNLYGQGDNLDLTTSHVIPALMRKAHEAKVIGVTELVVSGYDIPRREFLHVDDAADALLHLMTRYSGEAPVNVSFGSDLTIFELAKLIAGVWA